MRQLLVVFLFVVVLTGSVMAEQGTLRVFAIGGRQLDNHWHIASVNFIKKMSTGMNAWSFIGPRYKFGADNQHFVDFFLGYTFPEGKSGSYTLSPRLFLTLNQFSVWQDLEWYPETKSIYIATVVKWKVPLVKGLSIGADVETFIPDYSEPESEAIIHGGPLIAYSLSENMAVGFTWHDRKADFGGDFVRTTLKFFL